MTARRPRAPGRSSSSGGWPGAPAVAVGVWFLAVAVVGVLTGRGSHVETGQIPAGAPTAGSVPAATGLSSSPAVAEPPVRVRSPALGIDAPVDPVTVAGDATLGVPDDVRRLGWWTSGAMVGAATGTVVIDGHVDSTSGAGALFRLARAPLGATLDVTTADRTVRYVVRARRDYPKAALPPEVFSDTSPPRLVLITCGGSFNTARGHYTENIVVYATPE